VFEIYCDNLVLCWILRKVKDVGRLGRWILRLEEFKFRIKNTRGVDKVLADALSPMFKGDSAEENHVGSQCSAHTVYSCVLCGPEKNSKYFPIQL